MRSVSDRALISSRRNPLVRRLRQLSTRQGRLEEGKLLLEGTHLLQEVLAVDSGAIELFATESWLSRHGDLSDACRGKHPFSRSLMRCSRQH